MACSRFPLVASNAFAACVLSNPMLSSCCILSCKDDDGEDELLPVFFLRNLLTLRNILDDDDWIDLVFFAAEV